MKTSMTRNSSSSSVLLLRGIAVVLCFLQAPAIPQSSGSEARNPDRLKGAESLKKEPREKEKEKEKEKAKPKRMRIEEVPLHETRVEPLLPPSLGYAAQLEAAIVDQKASGGLHVEVSVIPDYYRYRMAQEMEALEPSGIDQAQRLAALAKLHWSLRKDKGLACLLISISTDDENSQLFLQMNSLKSHLQVRAGGSRQIRMIKEDPKPRLESWKIFARGKQSFSRGLFMFQNLRASATFRLATSGKKIPPAVTVSLKGIARVVDRREENRWDYRVQEMMNVSLRQIRTNNWQQQIVEDMVFELHPHQWKERLPEPPKGFEALLARLEKEKAR